MVILMHGDTEKLAASRYEVQTTDMSLNCMIFGRFLRGVQLDCPASDRRSNGAQYIRVEGWWMDGPAERWMVDVLDLIVQTRCNPHN